MTPLKLNPMKVTYGITLKNNICIETIALLNDSGNCQVTFTFYLCSNLFHNSKAYVNLYYESWRNDINIKKITKAI